MVSLSRATAPWAYSRSGEPYRAIAALEAFATLIAVMAFHDPSQSHYDHVLELPALTDNQGNEAAVRKLSTNKFPLSAVVMELSAQLEARHARLALHWIPRESNAEADRLSNGDASGFSPHLRVPIDVSKLDFMVLPKLMEFGIAYTQAARSRGMERKRNT